MTRNKTRNKCDLFRVIFVPLPKLWDYALQTETENNNKQYQSNELFQEM